MSAEEQATFTRGLKTLNDAQIPYRVGSALAKHTLTNVWRRTKELDIYLQPGDCAGLAPDRLLEMGS